MTSRLTRSLLTGALASAWLASPAAAADPIMSLDAVRAGMQCTGYSVVRGIEPVPFDVEVLDVIRGDAASRRTRLLIGVSGPAVDATGLGPGFSGSPVYCPDAQGTARVAGAISESVGEYGGRVALATPIEAILGVPVVPPARAVRRSLHSVPLAAPLTISGLSPSVARSVERAGQRAGQPMLTAPAKPPAAFPPQALRAGSAMAVGLAGGDLALGAVGTVTYVDGDRVWGFGHELDGAGPRSLLLQDAYVYRVINHPLQLGAFASTYKLAAPGRTIGTLTGDGYAGVAGRTGQAPSTVPVAVRVTDGDTQERHSVDVQVADETDLGNPGGPAPLELIGPVAVAEGTTAILGASPPRLTGRMCASLRVRELERPLRFCNRYVTDSPPGPFGIGNGVASAAADDIGKALSLIHRAGGLRPLHVEALSARVGIRRGAALAVITGASMPQRVRPRQRVRVGLRLELPSGRTERRAFTLRIPAGLPRGSHRLRLVGTDPDGPDPTGSFFEPFSQPAGRSAAVAASRTAAVRDDAALERLVDKVSALRRYDGVSLRIGRERQGIPVFRDPDVRITGSASARVEVRRTARQRD